MRKRTHEEFVKIVEDKGLGEYLVLGKYIDAKTKVKLKHLKCGFEWDSSPDGFTNKNARCPQCGYDNMRRKQRKTDKEFKDEVYDMVSDEYSFIDKYVNNTTKLKIIHNECGYEYKVTPRDFLSGRRCPNCKSKRISESNMRCPKDFKKEFDELSKGEYELLEDYKKAKEKIPIKHVECGHVFYMAPIKFIGGNRCPKCRASKGEKYLVDFLTDENIPFVTQWRTEECRRIKPLPFDIAIVNENQEPLILIEYDGEQHFRPVEFFGGEEAFKIRRENDLKKEKFCEENEIPLISIPYNEDLTKYESVILDLYANLEPSSREIA